MESKPLDAEATLQKIIELREGTDLIWEDIGAEVGLTGDAARKRYYRYARNEKDGSDGGGDHVAPEFPDLKDDDVDIDNWLDKLKALNAWRMATETKETVATVRLRTKGKPIAFIPTSCWHLGGMYVNYEGFKEKLEELLEVDRLYWGSHGDEWENFPAGWGATVFNNLVPPHVQRRLIARIIEKLHDAGKLLYSMWSNHPAFTERGTGEDPAALLYRGKVPYFAGQGIVKLLVDDELYVLSVAHNFPGHSWHNPNHSQGRQLKMLRRADMVIQGDKHRYAYQEYSHSLAAYDAGLQPNFLAHLVQTGTAKDGPDPYTLRNWQRGILIWPTFVLSAKKHEIHRVYDREALEWYLQREDF